MSSVCCTFPVPDLYFVIQDVKLDMRPILSAADILMAVHGTTRRAWESIGRSLALRL